MHVPSFFQLRKKREALELQSMESQMQRAIEAEHEQKEIEKMKRDKMLETAYGHNNTRIGARARVHVLVSLCCFVF